jgi:hypothetical protein
MRFVKEVKTGLNGTYNEKTILYDRTLLALAAR